MDFKEIIPLKALRKFDAMCLHNEYLRQNKELRQQILSWAADMLKEARAEWSERRNDTIESIIECHTRVRKPNENQTLKTKSMRHFGNILK